MKWIVLAIVIFMVGYTLVNVYFRKKDPGYRPYQDAQDRATTARLLAAGWHKIPLEIRRPVEKPDGSDASARIKREIAGLGPDLESKFAEKPKLVTTIDKAAAPASVAHGLDYSIYFTVGIPSHKAQVGDLSLYQRGNELVLIPSLENLPGKELMTRWDDSNYCVTFSTANLPAGHYTVRIVALAPAAAWSFDVR